jgi:hypothetical protein
MKQISPLFLILALPWLFLFGVACWNPFASKDASLGGPKDRMRTEIKKLNEDKLETLTPAQHEAIVRLVSKNKKVVILDVVAAISSTLYSLKDGRPLQLAFVRPCESASAEAAAYTFAQKVIAANGVLMSMPERWEYEASGEGLRAQVMVTLGQTGTSIGDLGLHLLSRGLVQLDANQHGKMEAIYRSTAEQANKDHRTCIL